jgi:hypothetical protein
MKLKKKTFVKAYAYFKDQLDLAQQKEDNDDMIMYYNQQIDTLMTRYYSQ